MCVVVFYCFWQSKSWKQGSIVQCVSWLAWLTDIAGETDPDKLTDVTIDVTQVLESRTDNDDDCDTLEDNDAYDVCSETDK